MKKVTSSLLIFIIIFSARAQLSINASKHFLEIKFANVIRLTNGVGLVGAIKAGGIKSSVINDVAILKLATAQTIAPNQFAGVLFDNIPALKQGVTLWRYKPWNSWTKPIAVTNAAHIQDWDVQFFYWQYSDGLYGAAVPLSGSGFRTTLGSNDNQWGSKAVSYASNKNITEVPAMAIAFGKNPYKLFARIYNVAMQSMGKPENITARKTMPEQLQYIGWCTWNSSNMGKDLSEEHIIEGVKTFTEKKYPLGWVLVDDGWFQHKNSQLQSFLPDAKKFPNGFKPLVQKLKNEYGIKYVGVWHAFNGYWNGIDPASALGEQYKNQMFSWKQRERVDDESSPEKTYYFLKPEGNNLYDFYSNWHRYFKNEGFDFVKVDNQLVVERMAVNNYQIDSLSKKMHEALYKSINKNFNGAVINCMDMTADAYTNFGTSSVARAVEDYFPYEKGETYNLQRGNAAAHVLQAIYNSIYFSQMVYPDYDMFQSHNPNAVFHAIARTINNGPIYLTDKPGEQNFDILNRIVFADGKSIRSETVLLPTEDCLFQLQEPRLFKAFSKVRKTGLLALLNAADADNVSGTFKPSDVNDLQGEEFAVYEYFSGKFRLATRNEKFEVSLSRMGYQLQYVVPIKNGFASFGLINKYNAPATIISEKWVASKVEIKLYEGGTYKAYSKVKPKKIVIAGKEKTFTYNDKMITVIIPATLNKPVVTINL